MIEQPQPAHCLSFAEWLERTRLVRNLEKQDLAEVAGKSPQAVSKWYKGGKPGVAPLKRLSQRFGVEYLHLRALVDGQPLPEQPRKSRDHSIAVDIQVERIKRKLELLAGDEEALEDIESQVDHKLDRLTKAKRRQQRDLA